MQKPLIALLSQTPQFSSELASQLSEHCDFVDCESIDDVLDVSSSRRMDAFIADFSRITHHASAESELLDELQSNNPEINIVMVTADECPEALERRAIHSKVRHHRGSVSACEIESMMEHMRSQRSHSAVAERDGAGSRDQASAADETVLSGITRQFETNTAQLKQMLARLEVAARHNVTILLIGETGSGKTFLSRLIHEVSPRCDEPFLHVACGALPSELIESELFGHVKGAFTSAHADKEGKFLAAGGGTVLLDEIDVLGPEQQVKLLRVIETGEFEPVGSNQTQRSRARLVAASNLDLKPLVEAGKFRPDLYYRLNTLRFEIPPLRSRQPDVAALARKFVAMHSQRHGVHVEKVDPDFIEALHNYPWPGNVRELENAISSAVIYCEAAVLRANNLPPEIVARVTGPTNDPSVNLDASGDDYRTLGRRIQLTEREMIEQALLNNNFSRTNTARDLGISRVTLYNKMKKYDMFD